MVGISLKELVRENIRIADTLYSGDSENRKIRQLLLAAEDGMDAGEPTFELLSSILGKYESLSELIFKIAVMRDDEGNREEALFLYRFVNMLKMDPRAFNNMAVIYAENNNAESAKTFALGIKQFPEDSAMRENFNLLNQ